MSPEIEFSKKIKNFIFYSKYSVWDNNAWNSYKELMRNQWKSRDELHDISWQKIGRLLRHAYQHVPFYKRHFDSSNLHPNDIIKPEDFKLVPFLTRDHLRNHFNELIADNVKAKHLKLSTTGGTTGVPVKVYLDRRVSHAALSWRMFSWWGVGPGMDIGIVWREERKNLPGRLLERTLWWPTRQIKLNASNMTIRSMERFLKEFNYLKPSILHGYTGAIHHLANFIKETDQKVWSPKLVWVTSTPLSAVHRRLIESVFRAPVYDQYASCEIYWISAQCKIRQNLHIFSDARYLEIVDDQGNPLPAGKEGKVAVTDLENYAFPIIRYLNGDRGTIVSEQCPCGINLPLMAPVKGKYVDNIRLPDGTNIPDMNVIFDKFPDAVSAFQVRQKADFSIQILYVSGQNHRETARIIDIVKNDLIKQTRAQVSIDFKSVKSIPPERGKLKYIISEIPNDICLL